MAQAFDTTAHSSILEALHCLEIRPIYKCLLARKARFVLMTLSLKREAFVREAQKPASFLSWVFLWLCLGRMLNWKDEDLGKKMGRAHWTHAVFVDDLF